MPLLVDDQARAVIMLYAAEAGLFDKEEFADLSFGLNFIKKTESLNFLAYYDALTVLPNRMLFRDLLDQVLREKKLAQSIACVMLINLERGGQINDALARMAGDSACVARLGGDTFALIVSDLSEGERACVQMEQTLLDPLEAVFLLGETEISVSARAGMALFPDDGADAATLLQHAELARRNAKASGTRVRYFASQMNAASAARIELESALRVALEMRQFVVHYQPRVDLASGRIVSAEALIRWQHPHRGMVPPAQFIGLCEETGLIVPIGAWLIDAVCAQQVQWRTAGIDIVPVAANLSARQFKKGNLVQTIAQATARHGLEQKHLEFELTESIMMDDPEQAIRDLQALKAIGAALSLDDFGTGYSSLAYLQRFPFDFVKIDRAFVSNVASNPNDAAIVSASIAMAHSLKLQVVAEGLETEAQLRSLQRLRCDQMQGYYFSAPVDPDKFGAMLREEKCLPSTAAPAEYKDTLLIVDDDPSNLSALRRSLRREGYRILVASGGEEGLALLSMNEVQVIISDQRMQGMSGTQFLGVVKQLYPATMRIILSGYTDLEVVTESVNQGAVFKFLTKPWDDDLLRGHIRDAFRLYRPDPVALACAAIGPAC